ncbi:MAG: flavodoxin domain-containing protein, partial [Anaerolineae bacterium]
MYKKILVAFASGSGSTAEVARAIGDVLAESGVPVDVTAVQTVNSVADYSAIVLGSSIRLGRWLPEAVEFLERFKDEMQDKPVAYFTTCLTMVNDTEENRRTVLAYLEPVRQLAPAIEPVGLGLFAGSLTPEQHTIRAHIGLGPFGDYRDWAAIKAWAEAIRPAILAGEGERPYNPHKV